jgi:hypothetical protein
LPGLKSSSRRLRFPPTPTSYGFVLRITPEGEVTETLQDPTGVYALTTDAIALPDGRLAIACLTEPHLGLVRYPSGD